MVQHSPLTVNFGHWPTGTIVATNVLLLVVGRPATLQTNDSGRKFACVPVLGGQVWSADSASPPAATRIPCRCVRFVKKRAGASYMLIERQRTPSQFVPNFILSVFTLTILFSLGCSSGRSSQPVLPPTTPVVASSVPANGASAVPFNTSIAVTFNVDIDPATLTPSTFYVSNVSG